MNRVLYAAVLLLLPVRSCFREAPVLPDNWASAYTAHLTLDSTVLVATVVADHLEVPWEVTWGSDDHLWYTLQNGSVYRLNPTTTVSSGSRRSQQRGGLLTGATHTR